MTNVKVPVTTIFRNAREFFQLAREIFGKNDPLPVTIFDNMPVKSQKVPVTIFESFIMGTLGCHGEKKRWVFFGRKIRNMKNTKERERG